MDEQAVVQRKLSRKNSKNTSGKSLWHRKSTKKSTEPPTTATSKHFSSLDSTHSVATMDSNDDHDDARGSQDSHFPSLLSRSIIPDPLGELPAWFKKENDMAAANISTFRIKYPLHNPNGPRWYKNHHLLPPAHLNPPPSFFSPSFPPMAASIQERSEDSTRLPGPSRTPSSTPLPTPSSSQVRIPEPNGKPRSRKTSQDNVDMMDLSDPWGTHWHHQSPYDAGSNTSPVSVDSPEGVPRSRSRLSSMNTGQTRRKTVTPSPLSQSTSAIHLQAPEPPHVTRKLSKRNRKPVFGALFGGHEKGASENNATSPVDGPSSGLPNRSSTVPNGLHINVGASRRHSTLSPMSIPVNASTAALSSHSSAKNERRGSVLGRLVRKFSILKKSTQDHGAAISERAEDDEHPVGAALSAADDRASRRSFFSQRQSSPEKPVMEKKHSDPSKRVPPPRVDLEVATQVESGRGPSTELEREINDHRSSISCDVPFSPLGKLTIANPDAPSSGGNTPVRFSMALPPEVPSEPLPQPRLQMPDMRASQHLHPADAQDAAKRLSSSPSPIFVPRSASPSGKSSPAKGLLSPISVSAPTFSLPDIAPFIAHVQSPTPPVSTVPSASSSSSAPQLSTSAPQQSSAQPPRDVPSSRSTPSPVKETPRPVPPHLIMPVASDSPLSRASVLANPPTPYNTDEPHSELPTVEKVPTNRSAEKARSRDPSPAKHQQPQQQPQPSPTKQPPPDGEVRLVKSNSTTSRKTETFKLVRNPSDKVSSHEAINAEGEQWLVINSADVPRRRRTKEKAERSERVERVEKPSSRTSRDRERERDRDRERERERERDRDRDRERERDRDRGREREREREREKEREREREREKERERESRREQRRQEKAAQEAADHQRRAASHARVRSPPTDKADSSSLSGRPSRARSLDTSQRPISVQPMVFTLQDEPPRLRKSDERPRDSHHQGHSKSTRPGPSPIVTVARVDHLPSGSARPTSELTSAADINALKAREAWEMDRLWKGRSMYQGHPETNVIASPSSQMESKPANGDVPKDAMSIHSIGHGSSHTSYVVQPLQAHPIPASVFYANMPSAPPPIIYAPSSSYGQSPHSSSYTTYRSLPNSFTFPSKDAPAEPPARVNPLPRPPRESTYQPTHLPTLADRGSGSASEYWTKYTNVHSPS
ncbi:hypothetical protein HYDPIDRAFT_167345 [Hydnomerulius pinastri MD-312]|uniref:Uncharacterized protein n=1 Tax=Hydnomerulius pinastri MD-312 TaxID=994086 RepID=A0A0C9WFP7_9AGAM|nr:hypothetical protein HYDPIDRAFT_167345 [Hydnomerulius pinastri MD-312]